MSRLSLLRNPFPSEKYRGAFFPCEFNLAFMDGHLS